MKWTRNDGWQGLQAILWNGEAFQNSTGRFRGESFNSDRLPDTGWMDITDRAQMQNDLDNYGIDYIVWSFWTPIAWRTVRDHPRGGRWYSPDAGYSQMTKSQHLSPLRPAIAAINNQRLAA